MKLTDTAQFQQDSGTQYGDLRFSVSFTVRERESNELIHKDFEFSSWIQEGEWTLSQYTERRTPDTELVSRRNWRTVEDIHWTDGELGREDIDVPQYVIDELDEFLDGDVIKLK